MRSFKLLSDKKNGINNLKKVHDRLFPEGESMNGSGRSKEYPMEEGTCFAWHQYAPDGKEFSVDKWFNSKGSRFPKHAHSETECVVVVSGQLNISYKDREVVVRKGEAVCNLPGEEHWAHFLEDTHYYTITIPPAEEFPHNNG